MPDESADVTAEQYAKRQADEYGQFVANVPITHNGALAYAPGHPVPASNVEQYGYLEDGLVRRADEPAPSSSAVQATPPQGDDIVVEPAAASSPDADVVPESTNPEADVASGSNE